MNVQTKDRITIALPQVRSLKFGLFTKGFRFRGRNDLVTSVFRYLEVAESMNCFKLFD